MLQNQVEMLVTYHYTMEPGDGTHYEFFVTHNPGVSGIGLGVVCSVYMPGGCGVMAIPKEMAADPANMYRYLSGIGHGGENVHPYTLAVVCLALKVLVNSPNDLSGAVEAVKYDSVRLILKEVRRNG